MDEGHSLIWKKHYDETSAELAALDVGELEVVNVDVVAAYSMVIAALPRIRATCAGIGKTLTGFDPAQIDAVERYAGAMMYAHQEYVASSLPVPGFGALLEEASNARQRLRDAASPLAKRGMIDASRLREVKGTVGYRNVALDLLTLTGALRDAWPTIENKTPLDLAELDAATSMAKRLLDVVGQRGQVSPITRAAMEQRQRAFTLLVRNYNEVRAAIVFLRRRQGDADRIAPSLYAGRGGRGKKRSPRHPVSTAPELPRVP